MPFDVIAFRESLSSRERGLKLFRHPRFHGVRHVAPLAGAWIETSKFSTTGGGALSLPSRERGLKHHLRADLGPQPAVAPLRERGLKCDRVGRTASSCALPARERGLKLINVEGDHLVNVAPLAGAWIETAYMMSWDRFVGVAPPGERGLKLRHWLHPFPGQHVAPIAGAWIETTCPNPMY